MNYEEIYSRFYLKETDPGFFKLSKEEAYDRMCGWMHSIAALPYVRRKFSALNFDDELNEITYELSNSVDEYSDKDFVIEMFAQGMVICWMKPQIDNAVNSAKMLGTKEEKMLLNNYKTNIERLGELERNFKKFIRDYGYLNNTYLGES